MDDTSVIQLTTSHGQGVQLSRTNLSLIGTLCAQSQGSPITLPSKAEKHKEN